MLSKQSQLSSGLDAMRTGNTLLRVSLVTPPGGLGFPDCYDLASSRLTLTNSCVFGEPTIEQRIGEAPMGSFIMARA